MTTKHCVIIFITFLVPPRWILEPTDKAFAQGSDAKVECKADGFPKPQVTWKRAEGMVFPLDTITIKMLLTFANWYLISY